MFGIVVEYDFSGDESEWRDAIDDFIGHINADDRLRGRFSYQVNIRNDGGGRVHIGQWDEEETLTYLQSQTFFSEFAGKVRNFAGGAPKATTFKSITRTDITRANRD
ncbi:MAG: hypothetical protein QF738_12415 [Rhodospirillales bacterium]|nr:hypothetical protein [Rhodospirillales bacterium]